MAKMQTDKLKRIKSTDKKLDHVIKSKSNPKDEKTTRIVDGKVKGKGLVEHRREELIDKGLQEKLLTKLHPHTLVKKMVDRLEKLETSDVKKHRALSKLIKQLKGYSDDYLMTRMNLKEYKSHCLDAISEARKVVGHRSSETWGEFFSEVFRKMFNLIDRGISAMTGAKKMEDTSTPGAKLFGRTHFFNKLDSKLGVELQEFSNKLKEMDKHVHEVEHTSTKALK